MLSYLRKKTKIIMIVVAVIFAASMFYGLGYSGIKQLSSSSGNSSAFIKVNGKDVDPLRYNNIFARIRQSFPEQLKPQDVLFIQSLALSQTIDFSIMLDEARHKERISGQDLDQALDQIAKQEKLNNQGELKNAVERSKIPWSNFKKLIKDEMLVQKMINDVKNSAQFGPNDMRELRASHILITIKPGPDGDKNAKKLAEDIKNRLQKGENFAKLAKQYSDDPGTKDKGGDLGYFGTGSMVKPFEDAAYSQKMNEVGGPIKTDYGYHIIIVTDARLKKIKGKTDVEAAIRQEKQEKAFQDWFYKLKQKAKVEILDHKIKAIDLRYKGKLQEAVVEYQKAIKESPRDVYARISLGELYEEMNNTQLAIEQYKDAVGISPADPNLYLTLGKAYLKAGQDELALEQFKKASLIAGDNKQMHQDLAKTFKGMGLSGLASKEKAEVIRIERKEAFEQGLQEKSTKIKTE